MLEYIRFRAVPEADNNGVPSGSGDGSPEIKPSIQQNSPATLKPEPISEHDETQSVASASTLKSSAMEACGMYHFVLLFLFHFVKCLNPQNVTSLIFDKFRSL